MKWPEANIEWHHVSFEDTVERTSGGYVINGKAVAFWESREAPAAQRFLDDVIAGKVTGQNMYLYYNLANNLNPDRRTRE